VILRVKKKCTSKMHGQNELGNENAAVQLSCSAGVEQVQRKGRMKDTGAGFFSFCFFNRSQF